MHDARLTTLYVGAILRLVRSYISLELTGFTRNYRHRYEYVGSQVRADLNCTLRTHFNEWG